MARAAARRVARLDRHCARRARCTRHSAGRIAGLEHLIRQPPPAPRQLIGKAFNYLALGWLLVGAGLLPHIAAGLALLVVVGVCVLAPVATPSAYGWADLAIALLASIMVARWMPTSQPRSRTR